MQKGRVTIRKLGGAKTKVWLFYKDNSLYAFTADKHYSKNFKRMRNMNKFYVKKVKMTDEEFRGLLSKENKHQLFDNVLFDGKNDFMIATTYEEDEKLNSVCDDINDNLLKMEKQLMKLPFSSNVRDVIGSLISFRKQFEKDVGFCYISLDIFFNLFSDTF